MVVSENLQENVNEQVQEQVEDVIFGADAALAEAHMEGEGTSIAIALGAVTGQHIRSRKTDNVEEGREHHSPPTPSVSKIL